MLRDNNSSAFKAEVDDNSLSAKRIVLDKGLFDSLETAVDSIAPAPLNLDRRHDINNFPGIV